MRPCEVCKGEKILKSPGFTAVSGEVYPPTERACISCEGRGEFPEIDVANILKRILVSQGKNKGKVKAAFPSPFRSESVNATRAYYVWRMARFHGGKDVTMPMTASMMSRGDPFRDELDAIVDQVAKAAFGTDLAAALRWKGLLY